MRTLTSLILSMMRNNNKKVIPLVLGLGLAVGMMDGKGIPGPALAATPDDGRLPSVLFDQRPQNLVMEIQRRLRDMELYGGPLHGRLSPETEAAIRAFQRRTGQDATGEPSYDLLDTLEAGGRVDELLGRLNRARRDAQDQAREALLNNPATRDLLAKEVTLKVTPPEIDERACFDNPEPACLLGIAYGETKAVTKTELRDWALGEVLVAQAKAGLLDAARVTVRDIQDPRLILVALRNIAEALAKAGLDSDALTAAQIIPDADRRGEALQAVLSELIAKGRFETAQPVMEALKVAGKETPTADLKVQFHISLAEAEKAQGDLTAAKAGLVLARAALGDRPDGREAKRRYESSLRRLAEAHSIIGNTDEAASLAEALNDEAQKTSVYVQIAQSLAAAGDTDGALDYADKISEERYRSVALAHAAEGMVTAGDAQGAIRTLEKARSIATAIHFPFARDFALSRIALAYLKLTSLDADEGWTKSKSLVDALKDKKLRAQVLWVMYAEAERQEAAEVLSKLSAETENATEAVISRLSRVWIHVDMALDHANRGETGLRDQALLRARLETEGISDPWARARALAKLSDGFLRVIALDAGASGG